MKLRHRVITTLAAVSALLLVAGPALAHSCVNASKQAGAGSAGDGYYTALIDVEGTIYGFVDEEVGNTTPNGRPLGGWFTVHFIAAVDGQEPVEIASYDVLIHQSLPEAARLGGPGDTTCDGVGIDDIDACLNPIIEDFLGSL